MTMQPHPTTGNALLTAALDYAARDWHVFPCHTPTPDGCSCRRDCGRIGKHPRTKNGLKDATADEAAIRRWWEMWPSANIGIATGAISGLVVLDNDSYKGGDDSLKDLQRSYQPLPESVQQLTGGGGVQYFFAHPGMPVKNGVEMLGAGLDIRGDGGYVIAPPSLHAGGKQYIWELSHHPDEMPLAPPLHGSWRSVRGRRGGSPSAPVIRSPNITGTTRSFATAVPCAPAALVPP